MNRKKIIVLFFSLITLSYSQQTENYFPHAIGDAWQYIRSDGVRERYEVVRDSLLSDSSKWLQIKYTYLPTNTSGLKWMYWVSKNNDSILYRNSLLYKFPMKPNDKWIIWDSVLNIGMMGHCWGKFTTNVFGKDVHGFYIDYYKKYDINDTSTTVYYWSRREEIVEGFGKVWEGREEVYYNLTGCIIDGVQYGTITDVNYNSEIQTPIEYTLYQNFPNPFNPSTKISFDIPVSEHIKILIFNSLGELIKVAADGYFLAGTHIVNFDASHYPSGVYLYKLCSNSISITKKMIYIK